MQTTDTLAPKVEYIKQNLDNLITDELMRILDIPTYNKEHVTKYMHTAMSGSILFAMQLVDGKWVDTTEIEQLKVEQQHLSKELVNLQQEAALTNAKG